jgi:hypothetical protein
MIVVGIVLGMRYLHWRAIIHGDLKPMIFLLIRTGSLGLAISVTAPLRMRHC